MRAKAGKRSRLWALEWAAAASSHARTRTDTLRAVVRGRKQWEAAAALGRATAEEMWEAVAEGVGAEPRVVEEAATMAVAERAAGSLEAAMATTTAAARLVAALMLSWHLRAIQQSQMLMHQEALQGAVGAARGTRTANATRSTSWLQLGRHP